MTNGEKVPERRLRPYKKYWIVCGLLVTALMLIAALLWLHPWKHTNAILPPAITAKITTFTPYQPELLPVGLRIEKSSVTFDGNLLVFRLSKPGSSIVVTEQLSPSGLADRTYPSEKVDGVDGVAYLSHDHTRTFGTLFATGRDHKPTMVLINTSDPFTTTDFKDLLRSFRAVP